MKAAVPTTCFATLILVLTAFWLAPEDWHDNKGLYVAAQKTARDPRLNFSENPPYRPLSADARGQHSQQISPVYNMLSKTSTNAKVDVEAHFSAILPPEEQIIDIGESIDVEEPLEDPVFPADYLKVKNIGYDLNPDTVYE